MTQRHAPQRIQLPRTKAWRIPNGAVVVARPSPYGDELREALKALRGKDLACWCPLQDEHGKRAPCHADVLIAAANRRWPATQ